MVRSKKHITFKAINGKVPPIYVPWNKSLPELDRFDLHVVEVVSWTVGQNPRGKYVQALNMKSRNTDEKILEVVKLSLNLTDWDKSLAVTARAIPSSVCADDLLGRKDLREEFTIGIQHPGLDSGMLFSKDPTGAVQIHILDVNAYLNAEDYGDLEVMARKRCVGAHFMDHSDCPLQASLPLLPEGQRRGFSFEERSERLAMTFSFPLDPQTQQLKWNAVEIFESFVQCDRLISPESAGIYRCFEDGRNGEEHLLRYLFKHACNFEAVQEEKAKSSFAILAHMDLNLRRCMDLKSEDKAYGSSIATRLVNVYMYAVNQEAGRRLQEAGAWSNLLEAHDRCDSVGLSFLQGRTDPSTARVIERLFRVKPGSPNLEQKRAEVLKKILDRPGLSPAQQQCFASSFHRRIRNAMSYECYIFGSPDHCKKLCKTEYPVFHVSQPLQNYLDILGMRALKCQLGWEPLDHLRMSKDTLQQATARANARSAAQGFAMYIFRQISWMNHFSGCSRLHKDALIGAVGPGYLNVLIPSPTLHSLEIKLPVNVLRGADCAVDYDPAAQSLKLTTLTSQSRSTWELASWSNVQMSCVVSRNYAQPIPHHAAPSSIVVSDLVFCGANRWTFRVAHKLYPEVFSSWPDLSQWIDLDCQLNTYASIWSKIRLCQVHAAAASNAPFVPPMQAASASVIWRQANNGRWYCKCDLIQSPEPTQWIGFEDMVIVHCLAGGEHVFLYGLLQNWKEGNASNSGKTLAVEIALSDIGNLIRDMQHVTLQSCTSLEVQIIPVSPNEKKSVHLLQALPKYPLLGGLNLTAFSTNHQRKKEMELRPLATREQVEQVVHKPCFKVNAGIVMNEQQTVALQRGLQRPFSMVQGPPGTGKTSFLVSLIARTLSLETAKDFSYQSNRWKYSHDAHRLLVVAPSNHAVDEIVRRLKRDTAIPYQYITRIYGRAIEIAHGSQYKGKAPQMRHDVFEIKADVEQHALHNKVSERCNSQAAEKQVLKDSRIVLTTVTNAYLHTSLNKMKNGDCATLQRPINFTSVIIDEAAQAEPDVVMSFMLAGYRVVVVGDHKQLGPVVAETNLCNSYVSALETPFLERMLQNPKRQTTNTLLDVQYRMHPSIRRFPSEQFYDSKLKDKVAINHRPELQKLWPKESEHVTFIDCDTPQDTGVSFGQGFGPSAGLMESKMSVKNVGEAKVVMDVCHVLLKGGCSPKDIAILTPYNAQQQEIRTQLLERFPHTQDILVGTVHAMQGSERECLGPEIVL